MSVEKSIAYIFHIMRWPKAVVWEGPAQRNFW